MAVAELKTKKSEVDVDEYIDSILDVEQRREAKILNEMFKELTGEFPVMWGDSMIGYGTEKLKYASGRELEWFKIGFSPRKGSFSLYVLRGGADKYSTQLQKLGKHSIGKICLYVKRLSVIDVNILRDIVMLSQKN